MKTSQTQMGRPLLATACSVALLLALTACNKQDGGKTVGQSVDSGIAKTEQAAKDAGNAMKDASKDAQVAGRKASTSVGEKIDDMTITAKVSGNLAQDPDLSAIKINVDTKDGVVTLNGPAPTAAAKDKATAIAKGVQGVSSVNNQLMVTPS
ncbi:BON domain-containing protein [Polaromonas sp.]|uniref:BON domain-containing protein n=1 Tax=Polaromonas sp. TaxID=1869339 RepID=UPI003265E192